MKTIIPRVWTYLLISFLKIFCITSCSLSLILLVARFQDIARFSAMVGNSTLTGKYILYQIPYLLPFALVLSSFITCYLIGKNLSSNHELTAIRVAGLSLFSIFTPIRYCLIWIALFCALLSFAYHPYSKARTAQLIAEVNTKNPFILLKNSKSHSNKRMYITFEENKASDEIKNVLCGLYNEKTNGLDLFLAKKVHLNEEQLHADNASLISTHQDSILIEDIGSMNMHLQTFSEWVGKNTKLLSVDCIPFTTLFYKFLKNPSRERTFFFSIGQALFFPFSVFFLSQVALYSSLSLGRKRNRKQIFFLIISFVITFTCYMIAKSTEVWPIISFFMFLIPFFALPFATRSLRVQIEHGGLT